MDTATQNNKLIRKTILSMFGGSLAAMVTAVIAMMADTILAGAFFNKYAIAAVAVGTPIINVFQALTQTITNGASIKMNTSAGKGIEDDVQSAFSTGMILSVLCGLIFIGLCQLFANRLVLMFGAAGEQVINYSLWYLRGSTGCIVFATVNTFMSKTLALYGLQKIIFRSSFIAIFCNILFSFILVNILPENIAIVGLGIGTWMGGCLAATSSYFALKKHNISLKFRVKDVKLSTLKEFVYHGLPSSGNNLADGVVSGIVNNIIVGGIKNGVLALAVFTAVKSIANFATAIILAINLSVTPLFGIMYGSRDRNGILRSYKESLRLAFIALMICAVAVTAFSPLLAKVFDMQGMDFYIGVVVCMFIYLPLTGLVRITAQFFESIEKPAMGFLYSAVPDSLIFPVLLALLVPFMGYNGIWISYSLNAIPFIVALYLMRSIKEKSLVLSYNRMFCLDEEIRDNVPKIDISIRNINEDITFISEKVYSFLMNEGFEHRTAHATALCLEEIAADFVSHTRAVEVKNSDKVIMDIKLFCDEDQLRTIIRNEAPIYNPMDFEFDNESFSKVGIKLAQRLAHSIKYSYVYKMNIITIDMKK